MDLDKTIELSDICSRIGGRDPEGILHAIQHTLANVYRLNSDRHDTSVGDDMATFGFNVYKNSWSQLDEALQEVDSGIRTSWPKNSFVVDTFGPSLKFYRGGADETFDIESYDLETGSLTKRRISADNAAQMSLFADLEQETSEEDAPAGPLSLSRWVVVHSGNPDDGLSDIWIGAPRSATEDDPSCWAFVFPLPDLCAARGCTDATGSAQRVSVEIPHDLEHELPHNARQEPDVVIGVRNDIGTVEQ